MFPQSLQRYRSARRLTSTVLPAILALGLCGCQTAGTPEITGSLGEKAETNPVADARRDVESYRDRFRANPQDADAALQYGQALRAAGQRAQAVAVLEQATIAHSGNKALLAGYGRALADNGNFQKALDVLTRAHTCRTSAFRMRFQKICRKRRSVCVSMAGREPSVSAV